MGLIFRVVVENYRDYLMDDGIPLADWQLAQMNGEYSNWIKCDISFITIKGTTMISASWKLLQSHVINCEEMELLDLNLKLKNNKEQFFAKNVCKVKRKGSKMWQTYSTTVTEVPFYFEYKWLVCHVSFVTLCDN